jgi:hypothetical protein
MAKYEMGEMPEENNEETELDMEGMDYENPEEEGSTDLESLKSQIAELDMDSLREIEAEVASNLSKLEEDSDEEPMEEPMDEESPEGEGSPDNGLMSLFS